MVINKGLFHKGEVIDKITRQQVINAFGNANFGKVDEMLVIKDSMLKCACGWYQGHTALSISVELGLIDKEKYCLTEKGKFNLYELCGYNIV